MNIDFKDFLENKEALDSLSNAIAERFVDKLFYTEYERTDDWGAVIGWEKGLKEAVENRLLGFAREIVIKEIRNVLQDDYQIRNTIHDRIKEYICSQFDKMSSFGGKNG